MSMASISELEGRAAPRSQPKKGRSKISNHQDLLPEIKDGRHTQARRFRDLVKAYVVDQGGFDRCSEVKIGLLRRLAAVTVQAEQLESRMVNGETVDVNQLCTLASTVVRMPPPAAAISW